MTEIEERTAKLTLTNSDSIRGLIENQLKLTQTVSGLMDKIDKLEKTIKDGV